MADADKARQLFEDEEALYDPVTTHDGTFKAEIIRPSKSRDASTLLRATYKAGHPENVKGRAAPHAPPLHIHMKQSETFTVLSGKIGLTYGYDLKDTVVSASDEPFVVNPWVPHRPWPVPDCKDDTVILMAASPEDVPNPMDGRFFRDIFMYAGDCYSGKAKFDPLQVLVMQHVTDSAPVMFPTATFLGPLRWWLPLKLQAFAAWAATCMGYSARIGKYDKLN
ncbi:hypothetical protein KVT40_006493 [Elsinoe batatas]|uniref:Uncharacterized protein n=1 Tax=Elsinoe batatas TaxID=2601811 RepID=A0A8K0KZ53_9PEZI|nr:hypothetical protein KVT40_006493 [Elsinoe batatas]